MRSGGLVSATLAAFLLVLIGGGTVAGEGDQFRPKPVGSGPWVNRTTGEAWPKPRYQVTQGDYFLLDPLIFEFKVRLG